MIKSSIKRSLRFALLYLLVFIVTGIAVDDFVAGLGFAAIAAASDYLIFGKLAKKLDAWSDDSSPISQSAESPPISEA